VSQVPDVIVVGAGVIGSAVAFELSKRSVRVLLLDEALPGRATSASAGGLWPIGEAIGLGCGVIYHAAQTGEASAGPASLPAVFRDFLAASNARFPQLAVELQDISGLDIEFSPGHGLLFLMFEERESEFVRGLAGSLPPSTRIDVLSADEVRRLEPALSPDLKGAALLSGEHQVNPMLLAEAFKRAAMRNGVHSRPDARVTGLRREGGRVTGVAVGDETISCGTVINAAGAWAGTLAATIGLDLPVFPVRGQIVLTETLPPLLHSCLSTSACYLSQKEHGEVLIGSTTERAGFDTSVTPAAIQSLCRGAMRAVPLLAQVMVKRCWAGLRPGTPDELPVLGPASGLTGYLNAAGGFRTGIVASPLTGEVVAQLATGERPTLPVEPFLMRRFE